MAVRAFLFGFRGGRQITEFDPLSVTWRAALNEPDQVEVTINLNDSMEGRRDWSNLATAWKHGIAVDVDGRVYGGPIVPSDLDDDSGTLTVTAGGFERWLATRSVLPVRVLTDGITNPSVLTRPGGMPDTSLDTILDGYDYGTIGKKIVQQAVAWPGCTDLPIVFQTDRFGIRRREYPAIDRMPVAEALTNLSNVENGPDFRFQLGWASDNSFAWAMTSGTEARPQLYAAEPFVWEVGQGSGLTVKRDPTHMGSVSWSEGGRSDDVVLSRMMYDRTLIDLGYPLMELETDASSSTTLVETLDAWNASTLRTAGKPWEFWSFAVRTDQRPYPHEYAPGDYIEVIVTKDTPVSGGFVPPGTYRRRIVALDGDLGPLITVTCGEVYG